MIFLLRFWYVFENKSEVNSNDKLFTLIEGCSRWNNIKLIKDDGANVYDLFKYKNVIITLSSAKKIQGRILNEKN